jgi:hypothetical protein
MRSCSTFIFCTPEVHETPQAFTTEVANVWEGIKSYIFFWGCGQVDNKSIGDKENIFKSEFRNLSMNDCFDICDRIRKSNVDIQENDFVVLLTNKKNNLNWFSATDGKNIYINVKNLELHSYNHTKYPVAYQILENIFQAICGIVFNNGVLDERIHKKPVGCINDMCFHKFQIIRKLKEGKICEKCQKMALNHGINDFDLELFQLLIEGIKNPALVKFEQRKGEEIPVKVDEKGYLFINGSLIELEALMRSIYIFFLIKQKGFVFSELDIHVNEMAWLYQKIRNKGKEINAVADTNIEKIRNILVSGRHNQFNPLFYKRTSEINSELRKQIDPTLVDAFLLQKSDDGLYSIKIDGSKVNIDSNFILAN